MSWPSRGRIVRPWRSDRARPAVRGGTLSPAAFEGCVLVIRKALAGTGATYRVHTSMDGSPLGEPNSWPPGIGDEPPENPAFPRRKDAMGVTRIR